MEDLSLALRAMFSQMKGDEILNALYRKDNFPTEHLDSECGESLIMKKLMCEDECNYTLDQLSMIGEVISKKWMVADKDCLPLKFHQGDSVFNMLLYFASKTLLVKDGDPICRYRSLLRWHRLTIQQGEDLFTTSYLASHDLTNGYERKYFDWDAYLKHDCKELNALFAKPMAELHMHLKGSSYNVDISWICLMNHISSMRDIFDKIASSRKDTDWDVHLYEKVRKAAIIRYYLAGVVECHKFPISKAEMFGFLENKKLGLKGDHTPSFETLVNKCHHIAEDQAKRETEDIENVLDYIPVGYYHKYPVTELVMASERKLMYQCFRKIYSNDYKDTDFPTLFYAYIAYKDYFRHIILQLNVRVGFANFANYEKLKSDFILKQYNPLLYKAAIEGFLGYSKNRYVEARIVPENSAEGIKKSLTEIYDSIKEENKDKCSIIFHFIKRRDESYNSETQIRHNELRGEIRDKAFAIYDFRKGRDDDKLIGRVVGIDAANSEIYARPEVFAQAFRFLRGHEVFSSEHDRPNDLNITYHVGEDFLDVADGLRAVEEALLFLGLRNGDRLGHALALGTDVRKYYAKRYDTICENKQVLLDNFAWLHHKCVRLKGSTSLLGFLETMFHKYFRDLYDEKFWNKTTLSDRMFAESSDDWETLDNVETYYLSWMLRGNSPTFVTDFDSYDKMSNSMEKQWIKAGLNHHVGVDLAGHNSNARTLYAMYHSKKYADRCMSVDTFTMPADYREDYYELLEMIQEQLLCKIEKRHIAIECNPSSNYKIGEMERYDEHPILRFFNFGLDTPYKPHNISVSINTDDQGVFSTSLEREYSLMALAMERNELKGHKNSPRAVIEWLNRVREMSIEQRFDYDREDEETEELNDSDY